jgi:two-component system, NarL family, nitrate/nitrite response regulator NarL
MIRIIIADDHRIVLDGLKALFDDVPDMECIATAGDGKRALDLCQNMTPDIVLMDIDMPVMNGIEATRQLKKDNPTIKVITLTQHSEKGMIQRLMECGSDGYLLKNIDQEELVMAIRKVINGKKYFSSEVAASLLSSGPSLGGDGVEAAAQMSARETEILKLVASGLSSKEIGEKLFISPRTVDTHRNNLMQKLDIHNIAGLIRFAFKNGYVE